MPFRSFRIYSKFKSKIKLKSARERGQKDGGKGKGCPRQPLPYPQPHLLLPPPIISPSGFFMLQAANTMPWSGFYDGPISADPTYQGMAQ